MFPFLAKSTLTRTAEAGKKGCLDFGLFRNHPIQLLGPKYFYNESWNSTIIMFYVKYCEFTIHQICESRQPLKTKCSDSLKFLLCHERLSNIISGSGIIRWSLPTSHVWNCIKPKPDHGDEVDVTSE